MKLCFEPAGRRLVLRSCRSREPPRTPTVQVQVLRQYPHDSTSFTQGLVMAPSGTSYYESSGLYGQSALREVDLVTGQTLRRRVLPRNQFAEGVTQLPSGELLQLTWREHVVHVYPPNFTDGPVAQFTWPREGWGITTYQQQLIISDGSAKLYFLEARAPYATQRELLVRCWVAGTLQPVTRLNELEMVGEELYANVWLERRIAVIDVVTGLVKRWLDLSSLAVTSGNPDAVLNGIAYHEASHRLFVTGKLWPALFELAP
jgi:glutaminyl-peptide cyclotransferase